MKDKLQKFDIEIKEKTDDILWGDVQRVIYLAHTDKSKQGETQKSAHLSAEEIKAKVGDGKCFIATYKEKVIGTCSVIFKNKYAWFSKGMAAYYMLDAVLPQFQGMGIFRNLDERRDKYVRENGIDLIYMYTSENNHKVQDLRKKDGFHLVSFSVSSKTNYYSVIMAKWLSGCPYSRLHCYLRFFLIKCYIKSRYRVGHVKRFNWFT